ncbi:SRPBCC family protein [Geodermatophilus sabuli]|uniref:SRPBCC family protein n=1 Tax=Geodermatophilus sabuli TaxID=1564158 RepID=A0A7K3VUX9_9ACTN|nr:SRPBCC family protein [Geodermatophilus sabuli]NEK56459.1 SRPBCC family protein [Geodermatophilus sabuli]
MKDLIDELTAAHRDVQRREDDGTDLFAVRLRRTYPAAVADVWDAVTDPERLVRWFLPVTGDLRPGGSYQLEGNVGGDIVTCEPPRHLAVTWGAPQSVVTVRLTAEAAGRTVLELEHTVPAEFAGSGAGALYVGPGWDVSFLALGTYLRGVVVADPAAWENTLEGQHYSAGSIAAWSEVIGASGTATADEIAAAADTARAQFTPDLVATPGG